MFSENHRNESFSSSFTTSCWLFNLATSIGDLPSKFWRVLKGIIGEFDQNIYQKKLKQCVNWIIRLTQQLRCPAEEIHIPSCRNQLHNEEQCSCSYQEHPPLLQPPEGPEHILPEMWQATICLAPTCCGTICCALNDLRNKLWNKQSKDAP